MSLSLRSLATNKKIADPLAKPDPNEPQSLDDILRAKSPGDPNAPGYDPSVPEPNMTRDTEVSKIISPEDAAGSQVIIIRGSERTTVQFGPNANPAQGAPK